MACRYGVVMDFIDSLNQQKPSVMPDVASKHKAHSSSVLDWVGMSEIEMPVVVEGPHHRDLQVSAKVQAFVNLNDPDAKGIHMSRLYLSLDEVLGDRRLNGLSVYSVLKAFAKSHQDLSDSAHVEFSFDYLVRRPALKTDYAGWKGYPVKIAGTLIEGELELEMSVSIPYSSTCPCSAALARQLIQKQFEKDFSAEQTVKVDTVLNWLGSEEGIIATPHSQRSYAQIKINLAQWKQEFPILTLIDRAESVLKTAVQTAVKREDEQEFALLNGQNLMFCEDAARRIKGALDSVPEYQDYWVRVNHLESLHAHDAVAIAVKGLKHGYTALTEHQSI